MSAPEVLINLIFFSLYPTGVVKRCGVLKIVHDKFKSARRVLESHISEFRSSFGVALEHNNQLPPLLDKTQVRLGRGKKVVIVN